MAATVRLCLGDMFEGPSDLLVVPCSTLPTISDFVQQRLQHFNIPQPSRPMELGEAEIRRFAEAESVAPYVAFAASVEGERSTTPEAIRAIGVSLGQFTRQEPAVRVVTAPLLGAGAGD